eukprot:5243597-Prorocentrum_lima.AAC.1
MAYQVSQSLLSHPTQASVTDTWMLSFDELAADGFVLCSLSMVWSSLHVSPCQQPPSFFRNGQGFFFFFFW